MRGPCSVSSQSSGWGLLFLCAAAGSLTGHQIGWLLGRGLSVPLFYPLVWGGIHFSSSVLACTIGSDYSRDSREENQSLFLLSLVTSVIK